MDDYVGSEKLVHVEEVVDEEVEMAIREPIIKEDVEESDEPAHASIETSML